MTSHGVPTRAKRLSAILVAVCAAAASGCLEQDTRHTLYLHPDGGVTWMVLEQNVRSTEKSPAARAGEEARFIAAARLETHPVAVAFNRLMPSFTRTTVLRDRAPFMVATEARFLAADALAERLIGAFGQRGRVTLTRDGARTGLTIEIDLPPDDCANCDEGDEEMLALVESLDRYRIVLTDGRFVEAVGFVIDERGTMAKVDDRSSVLDPGPGGTLVLRLAWDAAPGH